MAAPTALEQYMLELINRERAKAGAPPLAFNTDLNEAAELHSEWMIASGKFSHTGSSGSNAGERMAAAGYQFTGAWTWGENIAWATTRAPAGYVDEVLLLHQNLMNSDGHRANILNGSFREIGIGFETGSYSGRASAFVTQDFAKSGSNAFLTGTAFDDRDGDRFYDPGEGLGGIKVIAVSTTGARYATLTYGSGGYDIALPPGTYTVTFSGSTILKSSKVVTLGSKNLDLDLVDPRLAAGAAAPAAGASLATTLDSDQAEKDPDGSRDIESGTGSRKHGVLAGDHISNVINGGSGAEHILGRGGNDRINGGAGDDIIAGGRGNDILRGGTGDDTFVFGGGATASKSGGHSVRGKDTLLDFEQGEGEGGDTIDLSALGLSAEAQAELLADIRYEDDKAIVETDFGRIHLKNFVGTLVASDFDFA
jgi:Ca2+-binding RTX toxin-like protein